jgi:hypothetical protein
VAETRVLRFYQVQFGLLDETSLIGLACFRPKIAFRSRVSRRKAAASVVVGMPLSPAWRVSPRLGKQLQRVLRQAAF